MANLDFFTLYRDIIAIPSISSTDPAWDQSNQGVIQLLADWFTQLGFHIEITPIADLPGTFNLIISSSTFHWLHNLDHLLAQLAVALEPGGTLAFSLYGPDNLREIDELTGIGLKYLSLPEIETIVRRHFKLLHSSSQQEILYFTSPQEVLHHLRQTGVNAINRSPWSRTQLQHFSAEYRQRFSTDSGVSLTYQPLYFIARSTHAS